MRKWGIEKNSNLHRKVFYYKHIAKKNSTLIKETGIDNDAVRKLYKKGMKPKDIANKIGCDVKTIYYRVNYMKTNGRL